MKDMEIMTPCICLYCEFRRIKRRSLDQKEISKLQQNNKVLLIEKSVLCVAKRKFQSKLGTANVKLLLNCSLISIFSNFWTITQTVNIGHGKYIQLQDKFQFPSHFEWSLQCKEQRKIKIFPKKVPQVILKKICQKFFSYTMT